MSDRPLENRQKGHVEDFALYISDLRQAISSFVEPNCPPPYRLLCHSMGGNIGLRYLEQHPETFTSAVFSAPMWGIRMYARPPLWMRGIGFATELLGLKEKYVPGGKDYGEADRTFVGNTLTHDPNRFRRFVAQVGAESKLELGPPTLGWARQAIRSVDIIHAEGFSEAIHIPIRVCIAGADSLVSDAAQKLVADRLPKGEQIIVPDSLHELLIETEAYRKAIFVAFDELSD